MKKRRSLENSRLKAFAMVYALMILLLSAVMCSAFLYVNFLHKYRADQNSLQKELSRKVKSALIFSLSQKDLKEGYIYPFDQITDSLYYHKRKWGIYEIIEVHAQRHKLFAKASALCGFQMHQDNTPSLYYPGNKALQLSGATEIKTLAYLPKRGVKRAYINGKPYKASKLILGESKTATSEKPFQSILDFNDFRKLKENLISETVEEIYDENKSYINSFVDSTLLLKIFQDQLPVENSISGPVILYSEDSISIAASAQIADAIIIAPIIHISSDFTGSLQCIAEDKIIIDKGVILAYPSAIILAARSDSSRLILEENVLFQGTCIAQSKTKKRLLYPQVILKKNAKIEGQLICNNLNLQTQGEVVGSCFTNKLILKTNSSIYENHLMDAKFDIEPLSNQFAGIEIDTLTGPKRIVKWIY